VLATQLNYFLLILDYFEANRTVHVVLASLVLNSRHFSGVNRIEGQCIGLFEESSCTFVEPIFC